MTTTEEIKIGDEMFHPCSIDIIKHKVIAIHHYEKFVHYTLKAVANVGACGRLEVIVDAHRGSYRFVELVNEENIPHASGLQDFIEGDYYRTFEEARLKFYERQQTLAWNNMDGKERLFKEAKARYEQVKLLVETIKKELK